MKAPVEVLIRYLAIFRRAFRAMEEYGKAEDLPGMWMTQWVMDALHNVPSMIRRYDSTDQWHSPARMDAWMQDFPDYLQRMSPPAYVIETCKNIFTEVGALEELEMVSDLSSLELAPDEDMEFYLRFFYRFCLNTRHRYLWPLTNEEYRKQCELQGRINAEFAGVIRDVPVGLVHWSSFDWEKFRREAERNNMSRVLVQ